MRYLADRIAHSCRALVLVPELATGESASSPPRGRLVHQAEGRLAASRLRRHGIHALVARSVLWLHLHERVDALAIVGLGEGGAEALNFAAAATAGAQAAVALPRAAQQGDLSVDSAPHELEEQELRGLPRLDVVVAVHPSEFDVNGVAATLKAPTLALFDDTTQGSPQVVREACGTNAFDSSHSRAAAFDSALRRHAQTRDHWVQTVPPPSRCNSATVRELVSSRRRCSWATNYHITSDIPSPVM